MTFPNLLPLIHYFKFLPLHGERLLILSSSIRRGDAVFTSAINGVGSTFPLSETRVGFTGKASIVGGRGKFVSAVGELDFSGSFSLVNPNDAAYNADGWISY